jgi:hypothetical protein
MWRVSLVLDIVEYPELRLRFLGLEAEYCAEGAEYWEGAV